MLKVVAAAGAVDHDELVKLSEDAFSSLSTDPTTAYDLAAKVAVLIPASSGLHLRTYALLFQRRCPNLRSV